MRRFAVLGFTEAELGFVIAAVFAALAVRSLDRARNDREVAQAAVPRVEILETQRDSLARQVELLKDSLEKLPIVKTSTKVPQCWEKGEPRVSVAEIGILGRDLYAYSGEELSSAMLHQNMDRWISRGKSLGCRYVVRAYSAPGLGADEYATAVWKLRANFDVNDRPR